MILRAAFWIAVVAVLLPYEPDLGYGRRDGGVAEELRNAIQSNLLRVKADLKAADTAGGETAFAGGIAAVKRSAQSVGGFASGIIPYPSQNAAEPGSAKRYNQRASGE